MHIDPQHPLSMPGPEAVLAQLRRRLRTPLDERFVKLEVDALASQLIVTALPEAVTGETGIYRGQSRLTYNKLDLNTTLPLPVRCTASHGTTFRKLRQHLFETYDLWLDDYELGYEPDSAQPLGKDLPVDRLPDERHHELRLYAQPHSIRFKAGSYLRLLWVASNSPVGLSSLLDTTAVAELNALAYP
jgi:hypothetical protein